MDSSSGLRVLFAGQYWPGANSLYIARAFERCGAIVRFLNDTALWPGWESVPGRGVRRLLRPLIEAEWNRQLLALVPTFQPDLVYVTNADFCWPSTIQTIRRAKIPVMCFYHDVPWKNRKGSRFSENIAEFDLVTTTRPWHKPEFLAAGARAVLIVRFGFDPLVHRPLLVGKQVQEKYGAQVAFIGTWENQRCADLTALVSSNFAYQFRLWGGYWHRLPSESPLLRHWQGRLILEQEIPVVYAASQVALHWVNWEPGGEDSARRMGDQHNSRTFQIAACGGALMLAQRTDEHRRFFEEDKEAVFFSDVAELRAKLDYWLSPSQEGARKQVAAAARARCLNEDYSWTPVVKSFLNFFNFAVANQ